MIVSPQTQRRAVVAGAIVLVLGIWGALVPFVGPTFGYSMGGTPAWTWSESHLTLHLLPGIAAVLGAVFLIRGRRATQMSGALLAVAGGVWFVIAPTLHPLWAAQSMGGMSMGGSAMSSALSGLGYHYGTGALIVVAAAYAWGALGNTANLTGEVRSGEGSPDRQASPEATRVRVDA